MFDHFLLFNLIITLAFDSFVDLSQIKYACIIPYIITRIINHLCGRVMSY